MTQFFFVLTNVEAEPLLKEELRLRYPELKLSYSRPGFLTFKGGPEKNFRPLFCRVSGISSGKFTKSELSLEKAWVYPLFPHLEVPKDLQELSDKTLYKKGETVTLVVMVGEDEYWVGTYQLEGHHFQTPGEVSSIPVKDVPSRAYYKLAEVFEAYDLPFENQERVLELGSAPGGASFFLLEQDMKVLGVDTAEMDERVKKKFDFKHIRRPFETLTLENFLEDIDWIICDINLPPTVVLKEIYRFLTFLKPRGVILTLKINDLKHLEVVANVREKFRKLGFTKVELKYLPSYKKEICLIALHS